MRIESRANGSHYVFTLLGLLTLTGLSWGLSYLSLGVLAPWIAIGIAAIKASLVALVFMHLADAAFTYRFIGVVTVLFIAILCFGVVADVVFR
jgi:cytochrome c oxidase subunit 4